MTYDVIGRIAGYWVLLGLNVPSEKLGSIADRHLPSVDHVSCSIILDGEKRFEKLEIHPHPLPYDLSKFLLNYVEVFDSDGNQSTLAMGTRRAKDSRR